MELSKVIGLRIRSLREEHSVTADALARAAQTAGFRWERSTVARIEGGKRGLTAEELLGLPLVLRYAECGTHGLKDLLPTDQDTWVELADDGRVLAPVLATLLDGTFMEAPGKFFDTPRSRRLHSIIGAVVEAQDRAENEYDEALQLIYKWWPRDEGGHDPHARGFLAGYQGVITVGDIDRILAASVADAERATARRLSQDEQEVTALEVATIAQRLWREPLTERRDRLVSERLEDNQSAAARRAVRGHVTRQLTEEIRQVLRESPQA